jgi:hypothetical protein
MVGVFFYPGAAEGSLKAETRWWEVSWEVACKRKLAYNRTNNQGGCTKGKNVRNGFSHRASGNNTKALDYRGRLANYFIPFGVKYTPIRPHFEQMG